MSRMNGSPVTGVAADYYLYMLIGWDENRAARLAKHPKINRIHAAIGRCPQPAR